MAKRRLSKQQNERIAQRRRTQGDSPKSSTLDENQLGAEQEGLVLGQFGKRADIELPSDGTVIRCHLRANLGAIVAGDRVMWRRDKDAGVVTALLPRHSRLHRPDSFGKLKLVAANVTQAMITVAPEPEAHMNLIDRYLVIAEALSLEPVILVNKIDLVGADHPLRGLMQTYARLGYKVVEASAHLGTGLDTLRHVLSNGTSIFVGQSGTGKSSLIQALLPDESIKIGALSESVRKGRHTTTHARLYHFASGGSCIDSPGIREFGLWHLDAGQIAAGFPEFRQYIDRCRFRNCSHEHEPGCALLDAVQRGHIGRERFESYRQIVASLDSVSMQIPR